MRKKVLSLLILLLAICTKPFAADLKEVIYDETNCRYTSYNGLLMCGYQGWFAAPGDPLNSGWIHYTYEGQLKPEFVGIDAWPDMREYDKKYAAPGFFYSDGTQANLFSSQDESTVDLHFKWMKEYGIDGIFLQRFVSQTEGDVRTKRVDNILKHALKAAKKYDRAICIMYDGSVGNENDYNRITNDWNRIVEEFKLFDPKENPTFLRHNGKPVFSLWGYGFSHRDTSAEWFDKLCENIKGSVEKKTTILLGSPYYWREQGNDCVKNTDYLPSLKKWCDIISPWAVGRYRSNNAVSKVQEQVKKDLAWCKANNIDYVPVAFPGFSWSNLKKEYAEDNPYDDYPREKGEFLWKQIATAKAAGSNKMYIAMFDEMDEATCIFKCETNDHLPLNGSRKFIGYDKELGSDYYLWLTGQAANWFHGESGYNATKPVRKAEKDIFLSATGNDNNNGLSANTAVASLTKALSLASDNDVINVTGFIDVSKENTHANGVSLPNVKITIDGGNKATSGFTGGGTSKILNITNNTKGCEIKNLTFKEAQNGAIQITNCKDFVLRNSIIRDCKSTLEGSAIYLSENSSATNLVSNIRIESCLIAYNTAVSRGGTALAMYNKTSGNKIHLAIINTTIYKNGTDSQSNGGALFFDSARTGSTLDLINCTITDNYTGGNAGHGAGIRFFRDNSDDTSCKNLIKRISNCIIESNIAAQRPNEGGDISNRFKAENGVDLFINNSYIGNIINDGGYTPDPQNKNKIGYHLGALAGLSPLKEEYIASQNSLPLDFDSEGLEYGDAKYLTDLGINTDQLGNTRPFINNICAIGAVEVPAEPVYEGESRDYTHLIMYGQSLSTGHESHVTLSAENIPGNYMLGDQVWINYGNSNLKSLNPLVGKSSRGAWDIIESPLLGAANHIQLKDLHESIIATSTGTSGRCIEDLSKESQVATLYDDYLTTLKSAYNASRRSNSTINCPALFWLQGEWNYQGYGSGLTPDTKPTFEKDEYKALMITLKNNMQADAKAIYKQDNTPVFYTYQVGAQYTKGRELTIGMAQLEASNQYADIICAGPVYPMTDVGGHLDANGYRWYGEMLGKVYYKTQVLKEDFKPLQPLELSRDDADKKKVSIKFLVPKMPLVLDDKTLAKATDYGFEVYNDNARQTISSIAIDGDCVIITCAKELTGKVEIVYAGANVSTRGHGNLRDSDDYEAFFTYQDLDKKDGNGDYVYPRHANDKSTTLRPAFEPKDGNGDIIYDKPYPLYNFSAAFYYVIPVGENKYVVPNLGGTSGMRDEVKQESIFISQHGKEVTVTVSDDAGMMINVFDISGNAVARFSGWGTKEMNLGALPGGVYVVRVETGTGMRTEKVVL